MNLNAIPIEHVLQVATRIKRGAWLTAGIGALASYGTQVGLLLANEVGTPWSYVIPATVDIPAFCAAMALQLPGLGARQRRIIGAILILTVSMSVAANVTGGHNPIARIAHAWPVVAYLLAELMASLVQAYAARLMAERAAKVAAPAPAIVAPAQTVAPVNVSAIVTRTVGNITNALPTPRPIPVVVPANVRPLPIAPLRPAILAAVKPTRTRTAAATRTRREVTAKVAGPILNPRTGEPYSERHSRRLTNGR